MYIYSNLCMYYKIFKVGHTDHAGIILASTIGFLYLQKQQCYNLHLGAEVSSLEKGSKPPHSLKQHLATI